MTSKIHLVRHAESVHNVDKNFDCLDPGLTAIGFEQAAKLGQTFPFSNFVGLVVSSPLRRAVQTTLAAFPNILDTRYFEEGLGKGVTNGAELELDPALQERSALPCDTGSEEEELEKSFPGLHFSTLPGGWQKKKGFYAADDAAVKKRANAVRKSLKERAEALPASEKKDIVVVTHGIFMKFLSEDQDIDLPKAGWRSYSINEDEAGRVTLVAVS